MAGTPDETQVRGVALNKVRHKNRAKTETLRPLDDCRLRRLLKNFCPGYFPLKRRNWTHALSQYQTEVNFHQRS